MEGATMSQYTSQFKIQIAKEVLNAKTYSEISKKYGIKGSNLKKWADEYEKYGDLAFEENGPQKMRVNSVSGRWPQFYRFQKADITIGLVAKNPLATRRIK